MRQKERKREMEKFISEVHREEISVSFHFNKYPEKKEGKSMIEHTRFLYIH